VPQRVCVVVQSVANESSKRGKERCHDERAVCGHFADRAKRRRGRARRVFGRHHVLVRGEEEKLFALLLDRFLYAPLGADGNPTALARSQHLRQACFDLIGALVSSGALGADGLDRGLNALGTQYMESPAVREWKEVAAMDGDDADRATKTSKFMGLRNMACT
jgi:hypothetical protein